MGPFPHDAPPATITAENPAGTDGFEFVEFAHPQPEKLAILFQQMGYKPVARHKKKSITVYRQGDINYILNADPESFAAKFVAEHGPCAPSMAWRVVDAQHAFDHAVKMGGALYRPGKVLDVPAIKGIGGSLLYFVEKYGAKGSVYANDDFTWLGAEDPKPAGVGFFYLDHLTHNVFRGNMDKWSNFYINLFNFRQIRFFDIEGKLTGLFPARSRAPAGASAFPSTRARMTTARSRNTSKNTRVRASSTSRLPRTTSTRQRIVSPRMACASCRAHRIPITRRAMPACPATRSRSRI